MTRARLAAPGAGLALLALGCFFFRGAVFAGGTLFARDIHTVWLPQVESFVRAVAQGSLPTWDPYRGFGQPLLADPSAEVGYPSTWLNLVLDPSTSYLLLVLGHLVLTGLGMRALALRQGLSETAALLGALLWCGCGPFLSLASTWHHMAGAAWIPWVILAGEKALERGGARPAALFAGALAAQILAGSADMVAMTLACLAVLAAGRLLEAHTLGSPSPRLIALAGGGALALAISALQWLPTLALARGSARSALSEAERTVWSLHPWAVPEIFLPFSWNQLPLSRHWLGEVLEWRSPWLYSFYCGGPALVLVAAALAAAPRRHASRLLVLVGAFLIALGRHTPVYGLLVLLVPPVGILRYPMKALVAAAFIGALLAAHGLDAWRRASFTPRSWRWGVLAPAALLAAVSLSAWALTTLGAGWLLPRLLESAASSALDAPRLAMVGSRLALAGMLAMAVLALVLLGRREPRTTAGALGALAVGCLILAHADLHPIAPRALFRYRPEAAGVVGKARVYVYDYSMAGPRPLDPDRIPYRVARAPLGWSWEAALALGIQGALNPPTAGRWGIFGSYDLDLLSLQPGFLAELDRELREAEGTPLLLRLLQIGSVDYVIDLAPPAKWPELTPVAEIPGFFEEPIRVLRVPETLPRSYVVGAARCVRGESALAAIAAPGFDPRSEVVLADCPAAEPLAQGGAAAPGSARELERRADRVLVEADLAGPGHLVLVDAWDPGWRAYVDGRQAPVLRANVAFRAVALEPGHHQVEFVYRPRSVAVGAGISVAGLLTAAALLLRRAVEAPRAMR